MRLKIDLEELLNAGILDQDSAGRIQNYYKLKPKESQNRLLAVFGVLGAVLVGLGMILIISHNWDQLTRLQKTTISFIPLVIGQLVCAYVLWKRPEQAALRESSAVFLVFACGAAIALVSQIYHIEGDLSGFLLLWIWLSIPLVYLMESSMVSLLVWAGITYFGAEAGYWEPHPRVWWYWLFVLTVVPHFLLLIRNRPGSNFLVFHNWIIPLSVVVVLGSLAGEYTFLMWVTYMCLFGLCYQIGELRFFSDQPVINNGFRATGSLGLIILLLILSFRMVWDELRNLEFTLSGIWFAPEFLGMLLILLITGYFFFLKKTKGDSAGFRPLSLVFVIFPILFFVGLFQPGIVIWINLLIFAIGLITIKRGADTENLLMLNYGLLIITALIACRFFDSNLSFVFRGLLFVGVGLGFFFANYLMIRKRGEDEK